MVIGVCRLHRYPFCLVFAEVSCLPLGDRCMQIAEVSAVGDRCIHWKGILPAGGDRCMQIDYHVSCLSAWYSQMGKMHFYFFVT